MSLLNEVMDLIEKSKFNKDFKQQQKDASKLTGKDKELKELGLNFDDDKGWDDYVDNLSHFKKLVDLKGYQSVNSSLTTAINSYSKTKSSSYNKELAKKISNLQDKLAKAYRRDDSDPSNDIFGKSDRKNLKRAK
jgi:hypothetical protein